MEEGWSEKKETGMRCVSTGHYSTTTATTTPSFFKHLLYPCPAHSPSLCCRLLYD